MGSLTPEERARLAEIRGRHDVITERRLTTASPRPWEEIVFQAAEAHSDRARLLALVDRLTAAPPDHFVDATNMANSKPEET